ncbi:hypothetical protein KFL_003580190 [Klebsormidium nitens]|uniref:Rad60/SUMO-like domain-containing protein n=1 Tax=Klebsormidium nitens TaxID=105231 RepID=A0A1Y1IFJ0_KLENI|nr:hypothetical protein KFL_003580190 [Klebsormidium nitens]|eukprot:GAQ87526.1 hypothetical protein KFL_003580190 [Klebsormidium nitens]
MAVPGGGLYTLPSAVQRGRGRRLDDCLSDCRPQAITGGGESEENGEANGTVANPRSSSAYSGVCKAGPSGLRSLFIEPNARVRPAGKDLVLRAAAITGSTSWLVTMEPTRRPQRQRRVPSRFLEDGETPVVPKEAAAAELLRSARPSGRPEKSSKRRRGAAKKASGGQGTRSPVVPQSFTGPLVVDVASVAGGASSGEPQLDVLAGQGGAARAQAAPEARKTAPLNGHGAKQGGTSSDDSDVMIVEPAPPGMVKVGEQQETSSMSPPPPHPGAQNRCTPHDPPARTSSPGPIPPAPASAVPVATEAPAPVASPPSLPASTPPRSANPISRQAAQSTSHEAQHAARLGAPGEQPASPLPVGPSASPSTGAGPVPDVFQPLFQREATPPRPDFSAGNDDASDSDSDGFDILAPRGRKGKKAAVRPSHRGGRLDTSASPAGSSPDGSVHGTPARRSGGTHDTSWLKPPSPELTVRGARNCAVPESATLLRLRQQRAELLALARGASLAPDRIQAQSTAEALERELQRDAAQREAQAAVLRAKAAPNESDDEEGVAGGAAREQGGGAQSVLVKVRASDGSQERFKVRCGDPLEKLFRAYVKKVHPGASPAGAAFSFVFDGDPIDGKSTPEDLGLEDDDMIEVVQSK